FVERTPGRPAPSTAFVLCVLVATISIPASVLSGWFSCVFPSFRRKKKQEHLC
uniref:Uncharacterized protein n=1 Tax=Anopheles dirus TaxID=7168 RepID=A0A182NWY2_9DIPT